ncbi:MAG: dipeptidase [Negativicutes bacterium]
MKLVDFHCDTILRLIENGEDTGLWENKLSVDIQKLRKGDVAAQFFALYVDMAKTQTPLETCLTMLDRFYLELEKNRDHIRLATCYKEFLDNETARKISAFLTIEEGATLQGKLSNLRNFYRLGVRLITLSWNYPNEIGFPNAKEECRERGLTEFGQEVVCEMNRLGMLIDVSHLSDGGFYDVARLSKQPFVASHSNARAITGHARNLTDDMIRVLAEKGGVTGINFAKQFLGEDPELSRIADMVRHIKYIRDIGGIEVPAVGTDFDGIKPRQEIANSGEMGKLADSLVADGFTETEIEKIFHQNALRIIRDVLG